jgi:hypothetical protein
MAKAKRGLKRQAPADTVSGDQLDPQQVAADVRRDRIARKMTWPVYAAFMGIPLTTLYKLAKGYTHRPHELTLDLIRERLAGRKQESSAEGAGREVVSNRQ